MSGRAGYREYFTQLVADEPVDIARAALLIAAEDTANVELERCLARLEAMGLEVRDRTTGLSAIEDKITVLTHYLHDDCGLRGDTTSYYDPLNSYIHEVLARKRGIPISLAVITITVAREAGIELHGVGFPSHFLVGTPTGKFIDPFAPLVLKTAEDCISLFEKSGGSAKAFRGDMLAPVTSRQLLTRMLTNLKVIYTRIHEPAKAIDAIDRILILDPSQPREYRDRGALHMHLNHYSEAIEDFEHYLSVVPGADERDTIAIAVQTLRKRIAMLH